MQSGYWQHLTSHDFIGLNPEDTVALLPVAAVEQHGPHLPLATDALINQAILERLLSLQAASPTLLILPAMSIGDSLEHSAFAGTLNIAAETLTSAWVDVGHSVARAGLRKLVIFNSHGGQSALVDLAALRLRTELGMLVVRANYFAFGTPSGLFTADELALGLHGGEVETSLMLHIRPDLVRHDALAAFTGLPSRMASENKWLGVEKPFGIGWMSQDLHDEGVCGNAAAADAARGAILLDHLAASLGELLGELAQTPLSLLRHNDRGSGS